MLGELGVKRTLVQDKLMDFIGFWSGFRPTCKNVHIQCFINIHTELPCTSVHKIQIRFNFYKAGFNSKFNSK